MRNPTGEPEQDIFDYKAALEGMAKVEEAVAMELAMLADELERKDQPQAAEMLQQACHHHRAFSIKSRALAASLTVAD
jgi:hypothetical protein